MARKKSKQKIAIYLMIFSILLTTLFTGLSLVLQ
ncbi:MAG: hypothetical protein K0S34_1612 [Bacillales bacterium]|nr:hypothetical protein [Bacillales bacterium]